MVTDNICRRDRTYVREQRKSSILNGNEMWAEQSKTRNNYLIEKSE